MIARYMAYAFKRVPSSMESEIETADVVKAVPPRTMIDNDKLVDFCARLARRGIVEVWFFENGEYSWATDTRQYIEKTVTA